MQKGIAVPSGVWEEATAVQRYLVYLSMLTDTALGELGIHQFMVTISWCSLSSACSSSTRRSAHYFDDNHSKYFATVYRQETGRRQRFSQPLQAAFIGST